MNYTLQGYIDCGAQTQRISKRNSTSNAPKHREFRKEILQAMQVGSGSPIGFPISTGNARLC
ncbi:hypothetical protein Y002_08835 [Staphylococcus aureus MUM270]|nr:hypothetical protein Y002_08835 [Staphylococcus aureus MUM270]